MKRRAILLINITALSALYYIGSNVWKCDDQGYSNAHYKSMSDSEDDAQSLLSTPSDDDATAATDDSSEEGLTPTYLQWDMSPAIEPKNWTWNKTSTIFCKNNNTNSKPYDPEQKIIVHMHLQHNAGTNFYVLGREYSPCATRACWQGAKHCAVSMNEEIEAENLRENYRRYGVQYVSYEFMLPPKFPLPFVSNTAREGLYFTTIIRDPFKVSITACKLCGS